MLAAHGVASREPPELFLPGSISGSVYAASRVDGVRQAGDPGVAGVRLELSDAGGLVIAVSVTDGAGQYEFPALSPGVYAIREHQRAGLRDGPEWVGAGGGQATGDDVISGISLLPGRDLAGYDFAEHPQDAFAASAVAAVSANWQDSWTPPWGGQRPVELVGPTATFESPRFVVPLAPVVQRQADPVFGGSSRRLDGEEADSKRDRAVAEPDARSLTSKTAEREEEEGGIRLTRHSAGEADPGEHDARDEAFEREGDAAQQTADMMEATGVDAPAISRRAGAPTRGTNKPAA